MSFLRFLRGHVQQHRGRQVGVLQAKLVPATTNSSPASESEEENYFHSVLQFSQTSPHRKAHLSGVKAGGVKKAYRMHRDHDGGGRGVQVFADHVWTVAGLYGPTN